MSIIFDKARGTLLDTRTGQDILNGAPLSLCYTLDSDDITKGKKPPQTPYVDRCDPLVGGHGRDTKATLSASELCGGVLLSLECQGENLSELGLNLPFNFMGKKNGGGWQSQYLFNSPYVSPDKK